MKNEVKISNFGSEITEIMSNANKVKTLLRMLNDNYMVLDTSHPNETEKETYSKGCGDIFVLLGFIEDCIDNISASVEPLMQEV